MDSEFDYSYSNRVRVLLLPAASVTGGFGWRREFSDPAELFEKVFDHSASQNNLWWLYNAWAKNIE